MIGGGLSFRDREQMRNYFNNLNIDEDWGDRDWKKWLEWSLEDKYEFINFKRPLVDNADYEIWKIVFEKYLKKLNGERVTVIAHSLGTIFILKYLVENGFGSKIKQLHLVAPFVSNSFQPVNDTEDTATFTFDISKVSEVGKYCEEVHLWHSTDDTLCMYKNSEFLKESLPLSTLHTFNNKWHFVQTTFIELFDVLRK